jgi:Ni/Co efflux regulator RcnB
MKRIILSLAALSFVALAIPDASEAGPFGLFGGRHVSRSRTVSRTRTVVRGGGAVPVAVPVAVQPAFGAVRGFGVQGQYVAPVQVQQCQAAPAVQCPPQFAAPVGVGY